MEKLLTDEFVKTFYRNMLNSGCSNVDKVGWAMGTRKWGDSFEKTCEDFNLQGLFEWYEMLPWHESDDFDAFLYGRIQELHPTIVAYLK